MVTVPARLLELPNVSVRYQDADVCILTKTLTESQLARPSYTNRHVLSVVRSGRQYIEVIDGPSITVQAGQATLLQRGLYTVTDLLTQEGQSFRAELIYFSGNHLTSVGEGAGSAVAVFDFPPDRDLPGTAADARQLLVECPGIDRVLSAPRRQDPVAFLERHFDKPLTLEDLAYLTGMSVSTFQRHFRRATGQSPRSWIVARRMQTARELLRDRATSVRAVAEAVGYCNTSHFIAAYRRTYGHTPLTEYRHFHP